MSSTRTPMLLALALLAGLGLAAGCASSQATSMRGLTRGEARELLALQAQREKASEGQPVSDPAQVEALADNMAGRGEWPAAIHEYSRAVTLAKEEDKLRLRAKSAELCLKARMFAPAESLFAGLNQAEPGNPIYLQGLGLARFAQDKLEQAQDDLGRAVALNPRLWRAHNVLGIIANRQGRPAQALGHFEQALALEPRLPALYNNQALSHMLLKDWPRAEQSLRQALALDPGYSLAANNLGLVLAKQGRSHQALRAFERGAGQAQAHNNLGVVLAQQGNYNQAASHFRQALETMPRHYPMASRNLEQVGQRLDTQPPAQTAVTAPSWPAGQEMPRVERALPPAAPTAPAEEGIRVSPMSYEPTDNPGARPARRGPWRGQGYNQPAFSEPLPMTETPEPAGQGALLAPEPKPRPLSQPPRDIEPPAPAPAPVVASLSVKPRATRSRAAASQQAKAAPADAVDRSRPLRQGLPVGFVGVVAEKDETHLIEGVRMGQDGLLHRVQGDPGRLVQGVAVGAGGEAREANGAQRVVRGKIEGGDIGAGQ
ncbi:MAG: tetratricopeptide repeat protein [Desulfarculus sp.]|nr:tetratricopeptide repeat protein [Desulfarculus sp.]